jgi:hypothetical protein
MFAGAALLALPAEAQEHRGAGTRSATEKILERIPPYH